MKRSILVAWLAFAASAGALAADSGQSDPPAAQTEPASLWQRDHLTGDWGGFRTKVAERGVTLDFDSTHYYQGLLSGDGDGDDGSDYGGRLDALLNFDTDKLGLWRGGGLRTHTEFRYGDLEADLGGVIMPTNLGMKLPLGDDSDQWSMSSIYFVQQFGEVLNVRLGRINTVDLIAGHPFFGGWGVARFMNLAFAAPPNGLLPPVIVGGIASIKTVPFTWTAMIFDPNDHTTDYGLDDLFDEGVNVSLSGNWSGRLADRTTGVTLTGIYSTKEKASLFDVLLPPEAETTGAKKDSWHASLQLDHFLYEVPGRPGHGLGLFVKMGISDGNPNPYQRWITGGFSGKGLIPGRRADSFGLGYFNYHFSDDLQSAVSPLIGFHDEHGMEVFYDFAVTPWLHITPDLQVVNPATDERATAVVGGLRVGLDF